jgi:lipopolysaccharide export system permease protein
MLNTLQKDLLRRHVGPFLFCLLTILFLLLMQFLILHIDKLVGKGLELSLIIELILLQLAYMLVLAIPMSMLVASLMAFGRFAEYKELTAIKAAGVKPLQLMKPILLVAVLMSIFLIWFSNEVLPEANYKARSLFLDIRMKKPGFDLKANTFYDGIEGYTFLAKDISAESDTLFDLTIFQDATAQRDQAIINSRFGILSSDNRSFSLKLDLYDGSVYRYLPDSKGTINRIEESQFNQHRIRFDLSDMAFSRTNPDLRRRDDRTMSSQAMQAVIDSLKIEVGKDLALITEHHKAVDMIYTGIDSTFSVFSTDVFTEKLSENELSFRTQQFDPVDDNEFLILNELAYLESQVNAVNHAISNMRDFENFLSGISTNTKWRLERVAQFQVEIYKKVSIPIGCIIFVLIGAPLGMLTKRGNLGYNVVISTLLFTFYWISVTQGEKLADRLIISPFMGMWFGNITLGLVGLILLYKVTSERRISDLWRSK